MNTEDVDQFQLLEEKIDNLIELIDRLKRDNESLVEKTQAQEEKLATLSEELARLNTAKLKAKQRITSLLGKIDKIGI